MIYFILIAYIALTFWSSLAGRQAQTSSAEGYFLAGRSLPTLSLFFTILATNFSAFYFLGFAGEAYRLGFVHYIMMALGTGFAGFSILLLAVPAWKYSKQHSSITPSELIYARSHSKILALLFAVVMIIFTLPYLALQIIGGGYILEEITGGNISYGLAIILLSVFTVIYVIIGGLQSIAKTDVKQGILMITFMLAALIYIASQLDGFTSINEKVYIQKPDLFSSTSIDGAYDIKKWFSFLIFWFFCVPMFPQIFMRFFAAKDIPTLKTSAILYALIPIGISILPVLIGIWGHVDFPDLQGKEADKILPLMLAKHTPPWFQGLIMTGAIAAFMSTLDSQLLALSSIFTRDILRIHKRSRSTHLQEVKAGRVIVFFIALIGLGISFHPFASIFDMGKMAFSGLAVLFPAAAICLLGRMHRPFWAVVGIIIGLLLVFAFYYGWLSPKWTLGFSSFIMAIAASSVISSLSMISSNAPN